MRFGNSSVQTSLFILDAHVDVHDLLVIAPPIILTGLLQQSDNVSLMRNNSN